jgi:uncharacterized protein
MSRIYLDAAPVIYTVETTPHFFARVDARLKQLGVVLIASEFTRMECRVHPIRMGDAVLLNDYDDYFQNSVAEIVAISRAVIDRATAIRARFNFKTPDSIHLAAAMESGCDVFYTGDHRLARFTGITIEVV